MKTIILFLSGVLLLGAACGGSDDSNTNSAANAANRAAAAGANDNANVAKDNVAELSSLINSPFEFDDSSVWREAGSAAAQNDGAPAEKRLIAVLKFAPENADEIIRRAQTRKAPVEASLDAESWFPAELIAQSQTSGDETLKGQSYAADDFVKAPYTGGKLTRINDTDYFILELTAR